ncbi:MAG: histidine kinase [Burkholderiales bacterium]|nr:histidine kinase [Burkholderiales bacterium]
MKRPISIRTRLVVGAGLVLAAFLAVAGFSLERAFTNSILETHYQQLKGDVYLLMAATEVDEEGALVMPATFVEPRLSLPGSGLYALVENPNQKEVWQSASTIGPSLPFSHGLSAGEWVYNEAEDGGKRYLSVGYGVKWNSGPRTRPMTFAVLEEETGFLKELAGFRDTLWTWLGGLAAVLLIAQSALLGWALSPLRRVAREIRRVESGEQGDVQGDYPPEIARLTDNLNTLIEQERARQARYKDALGDLAHSLKTPLAVLRSSLQEPDTLSDTVANQVARMDDIVQHQLGRAAASGAARFIPPIDIRTVLARTVDSLEKVYAERHLTFLLECPAQRMWRLDEGDAFEVFGNVLDNAAKWARGRVRVRVEGDAKLLKVVIDDDGPGFSDTDAALQRGVRLDERVPGHGIGLTVVADIVRAYNGTLLIDRGEWQGGRVCIAFRAV